jgi:uncharacterized protein YegP (UPF0339 family)
MPGKGETFKRSDEKFAYRLRAGNNAIVAADGGQGYENRSDASDTLKKLMSGGYKNYEVLRRSDGKFAFRFKAGNGQVVATDGGQGYDDESDAQTTASNIADGDYDGPIYDL